MKSAQNGQRDKRNSKHHPMVAYSRLKVYLSLFAFISNYISPNENTISPSFQRTNSLYASLLRLDATYSMKYASFSFSLDPRNSDAASSSKRLKAHRQWFTELMHQKWIVEKSKMNGAFWFKKALAALQVSRFSICHVSCIAKWITFGFFVLAKWPRA